MQHRATIAPVFQTTLDPKRTAIGWCTKTAAVVDLLDPHIAPRNSSTDLIEINYVKNNVVLNYVAVTGSYERQHDSSNKTAGPKSRPGGWVESMVDVYSLCFHQC